MSLLRLDRVSMSYPAGLQEEVLLSDVSMSVELGEYVGIWGARRTGKSTLLRILAGLQRPNRGSVIFDGRDLTKISPDDHARVLRSGGLALVQSEWRDRNCKAIDHVARSLVCEDLSLREARRSARAALERVGLLPCAEIGLQRLSPGEVLRVGLAIAFIRRPRLLMVDEPAISRSPSEGQEIYALLREWGGNRSQTLLVASETTEALHGADRIVRLGGGRLAQMNEAGVVRRLPKRQASH